MSDEIYDPQLAPFMENGVITQIGEDGKRHPVGDASPEPDAYADDSDDDDGGTGGDGDVGSGSVGGGSV